MNIEQFVMAYEVEQDRLRALLPSGFISLRPVLRINAEIIDNRTGYVEFNTAVEYSNLKGWINIDFWQNVSFKKNGKATDFFMDFFKIKFTEVGIKGNCPAEKDNAGCFFRKDTVEFRPAEKITVNKEFCNCEFAWSFSANDAHGLSIGKTLPAHPTEPIIEYPKMELSAKNAASIPCKQVLGAYCVKFVRCQ